MKIKTAYSIVGIMVVTIICKLFGFIREMTLANIYGTSIVSDSYIMAITIPGIVFGGISALTVGYLPIYKQVEIDAGHQKANEFTNKCLIYVFLLCVISIVLTEMYAREIVYIVAPGYSIETQAMIASFLKISIFHLLFANISSLFISYLNAERYFLPAILASLPLSLIQIIFIYISEKTNTYIMIYGYIISNIIQCTILIIYSLRKGYKYIFKVKIDKYVKILFTVSIPVFFSNMMGQINSYIDKLFSSQLGEGMLSGLSYSYLIITLIVTVFSGGIITVYYTDISNYVVAGNKEKLVNTINKLTIILIALFVPLSIGTYTLSEQIVSLIYFRGNFDGISLEYTAAPLRMYSIGIVSLVLIDLYSRVLYSQKNTKTTFFVGSISIVVNLAANSFFVRGYFSSGLALASSIASCVGLLLYLVKFYKLKYLKIDKKFLKSFSKVMLANIMIFSYLNLCKAIVGKNFSLEITIFVVLVSVIIYVITLYFIKIPELDDCKRFLFKKLKKEGKESG